MYPYLRLIAVTQAWRKRGIMTFDEQIAFLNDINEDAAYILLTG